LPSNSPHDHMILRVELVDSHGRWKGPCLQTNPKCDQVFSMQFEITIDTGRSIGQIDLAVPTRSLPSPPPTFGARSCTAGPSQQADSQLPHTPSRLPQRRGTTSCREAAPFTSLLSATGSADAMMLPSSAHADMPTLPKLDTNCTAPSLIPTVNGNTVRSFSTQGHQSAAKGSSTTASRSLTSD
jgi:hypothetical protein